MAAKFGDFVIEKRSIDYVPIAERHGKVWHLWPVWFSGDAHLATVATGVVGIALGGHFMWMALAVLFGCAFGTFFMAFHSTQGPQLGLPQMIQSRPQFGYVGALLVWGVALIAYIGFNAFNQILAAQTVLSLYGGDSTLTMAGVHDTVRLPGRDRLRLDPSRAALDRVPVDRRAPGFHGGGARAGAPAGGRNRAERLSRGAVSGAILRGRVVPGCLVHLRIRLFALLAARRGGGGVVLVDLLGRLHRRNLDDAGGNTGRGAVSDVARSRRRCAPWPTRYCQGSASHYCCARCSDS